MGIVHRPWEGTVGLRPAGAGLMLGRGPDYQCAGEALKGSKLDQPDPVHGSSQVTGLPAGMGSTWEWLDVWVLGTPRPLWRSDLFVHESAPACSVPHSRASSGVGRNTLGSFGVGPPFCCSWSRVRQAWPVSYVALRL